MEKDYLHVLSLIERLHQLYMDLIKCELDALGIKDINNVQALIIHNLSDNILSVGDLTNKRFYSGSNVSYNLKKLVEAGYVIQELSPHDRRTSTVRLSQKGEELCQRLLSIFQNHVNVFESQDILADDLTQSNQVLEKLMDFWSGEMGFRKHNRF